jgi:hypothetical protein
MSTHAVEFIYLLEGRLDCKVDGVQANGYGRRSRPHAAEYPARRLQYVGGAGDFALVGLSADRLWELFTKLDNVPDPPEVVLLAELRDMHFLLPRRR